MNTTETPKENHDGSTALARPGFSVPLNWYKAYEMEDLLKASPFPQVSDNYNFCIWLSAQMNLALRKGYEMAEAKAQNAADQAQPPQTKKP